MSHIVSIQTEVRCEHAVRAACTRLKWREPVFARHRLFSSEVEGLGVVAPDWKYAIVCDLQSGQLHYDNYEGKWGDPSQLNRFKQSYAIEKTKLEARKQGRYVTEQALADGTVELTIQAIS